MISAAMPYAKKFVEVNGYNIAYVDEGAGDPIVFVHGNANSSYMWRNIMPHLAGLGRLIAIDNIGQGDSDKLRDSGPDSYMIAEHQIYFDGALGSAGGGGERDAGGARLGRHLGAVLGRSPCASDQGYRPL